LIDFARETANRPPAFPGGEGHGVLIVGGGALLPSAYVAICHLRRCGCKLPLQLWHLGSHEIPPFWQRLADPLGVETVDATRVSGAEDFDVLGGWQCKVHAIVACKFRQVLLLDADNIPLEDPGFLLNSLPMKRYGQIFWPDFLLSPGSRYAIQPRAWNALGEAPRNGLELESGQLAVDRSACWRELCAVRTLNAHSRACYGQLTWGDKDTFVLGWRICRRDYYSLPLRPRKLAGEGPVIWQFWEDGRPLFQHHRKWTLSPSELSGCLLDEERHKEDSLGFLGEYWETMGRSGEPLAAAACPTGRSAPLVLPSDAAGLKEGMAAAVEEGQFEQAIDYGIRAITLRPQDPHPRMNLAVLLLHLGRFDEAMSHLAQLIALRFNLPEVYRTMGLCLEPQGRLSEAVSAFQNSLRLRPGDAQTLALLGNAQLKDNLPIAAMESCRQAIRLSPRLRQAHDGLITVLQEIGDIESMLAAQRLRCELWPGDAAARSALLYCLHYDPTVDAAALYREHRRWNVRFGSATSTPKLRPPRPTGRVRLGYVSPDFRNHTIPRFIGATLERHSRERFEVFCFSGVEQPDETTARIRSHVERWRDVAGLPDERLAQIIGDDGIDILVDLRGHAAGSRMTLFAARAAPVQINMVGYFDTTGLPAMDYRLTDAFQDPPGASEKFHTEQLLRMRGTCWCYRADDVTPPVTDTPAVANGYVTFGTLNKIIKMSRRCAQLWAQVLDAVPRSRLLVSVGSAGAVDPVRDRLCSAGIPKDRVDIEPRTAGRRQYLERFGRIDVALDTFPFNGITTSCDGLWMGVPLVSLAGGTSVSRAGRSILHGIGLGHLAADSTEGFARAASTLASDLEALATLRRGMRERMLHSPLMDHAGFTTALEELYLAEWHRYLESASGR
jgi:predicted O-linked N-acetylglucosamine transferase (SPINDLY family)